MSSATALICEVCGLDMYEASPTGMCGFCLQEGPRNAVETLVSCAGFTTDRACSYRVSATEALRNLGYTSEQAAGAGARAREGRTVDEITDWLGAPQ